MGFWEPKKAFRGWMKIYLKVLKTELSDEVSFLQGQIDTLQTSSVRLEQHELLEHHQPETGGMFIEVKV